MMLVGCAEVSCGECAGGGSAGAQVLLVDGHGQQVDGGGRLVADHGEGAGGLRHGRVSRARAAGGRPRHLLRRVRVQRC